MCITSELSIHLVCKTMHIAAEVLQQFKIMITMLHGNKHNMTFPCCVGVIVFKFAISLLPNRRFHEAHGW